MAATTFQLSPGWTTSIATTTRRLDHTLLDDKEHTTEKQREVAYEMTRLTEEAINRVCDAFEYLQLEMGAASDRAAAERLPP